MKPVQQLTEEERLQEIAELLATAALRYLAAQARPSPTQSKRKPATTTQVWDLVDDEVEKLVLRHLSLQGAALPADMEIALNLTHPTLTRRLARLREVGLIVVSGKTRNASYSLASDSLRN